MKKVVLIHTASPVVVTILCTWTPAFCRKLTGRLPEELEPAMPMPTCRGIMGIGVDWMGLTLATGLSSGREMCRLKIKNSWAAQTRKHSFETLLMRSVNYAPTAEIISVMKQIRKTPAAGFWTSSNMKWLFSIRPRMSWVCKTKCQHVPATLVEHWHVWEGLVTGWVIRGIWRARVGHRGSFLILVTLLGSSFLCFGQFGLLTVHEKRLMMKRFLKRQTGGGQLNHWRSDKSCGLD